jgi:hypothetical protein
MSFKATNDFGLSDYKFNIPDFDGRQNREYILRDFSLTIRV